MGENTGTFGDKAPRQGISASITDPTTRIEKDIEVLRIAINAATPAEISWLREKLAHLENLLQEAQGDLLDRRMDLDGQTGALEASREIASQHLGKGDVCEL